MNVIFLDIDGVLNHNEFYNKRLTLDNIQNKPYPYNNFDPDAIGYLNDIIAVTNAKIVISSSWRFDKNIIKILKNVGVCGDIIGVTPSLEHIYGSLCRGKEIDAYLAKHNNIKNYVILDDDNDMEPHQLEHFVKTNENEDGLNSKCRNLAIEILLHNKKSKIYM